MKDFALINGDLAFENGDFKTVQDTEELRQTVYIGMQTNEGEWFLNPDLGMNQRVFVGKKPNDEAMRAEIIKGAFQDERISSVDEIEIVRDTKKRKIDVSFRATAATGETIENEVNIDA